MTKVKKTSKAGPGPKKPLKYYSEIDAGRGDYSKPRTKAQQTQWEKDELNMINYPGRPKGKKGVKVAKKGASFDLNKDGKTTFKDVLIGRGVLPKTAKKGTKVKAKSGAKMGKCKYGCK